ncbi:MAG: isochorismatase family protein [Leptolyngbyaceae cyanobacterium]
MTTATPYSSSDRLSKDNAALVMIDHQTGLLSACTDIPVERLRHNIIGLAKIGKLFDLPVVLTQGGYGGLNAGGPLIAELVNLFPDVPIIDRHHPNAFDDPNFRSAIEATGRQKLILAGCTFDYCCALPALNLAAEGYDVYAVVDASGNWDVLTTQATLIRLAQHGVEVVNWIAVWGELYRDHNSAMEQRVMGVMAEHMPGLGFVTNNWMFANDMYPDVGDRLRRDEEPMSQ